MVEALRYTWVDPLHAIWVGVIVPHPETCIADYVWWENGAVKACDGAICVEIVTPPARICDDCV